MKFERNVGKRDRLGRAILAVAFALIAIGAIRKGRRRRVLVAATGALALGFNAITCFCGVNETLGIDTTET